MEQHPATRVTRWQKIGGDRVVSVSGGTIAGQALEPGGARVDNRPPSLDQTRRKTASCH